MGIYPNNAQLALGFGHFDTGNGTARIAMVATEHHGEKIAFDALLHRLADPLVHGHHAVDPLAIGRLDGLKQQFVLHLYLFGRKMHKKVAHKVQSRNLDGIDTQTSTPGTGPNFRRNLYQFYILHDNNAVAEQLLKRKGRGCWGCLDGGR
jgi:hypothetical protein